MPPCIKQGCDITFYVVDKVLQSFILVVEKLSKTHKMKLEDKETGDYISFSKIDNDGFIEAEILERGDKCGILIDYKDAIQIISHLKEQFGLYEPI